jgi:hypothetical protein
MEQVLERKSAKAKTVRSSIFLPIQYQSKHQFDHNLTVMLTKGK